MWKFYSFESHIACCEFCKTLMFLMLKEKLLFCNCLMFLILKEQFLPYYIRSNLKMICHGESEADVEQFCTFIDEGLRNEERKEILEVSFYLLLVIIRISFLLYAFNSLY